MNTKNQPRLPEILEGPEILEDLDFEILCDSGALDCREIGSHRADWLVLFSCSHSRHWCNARFIHYWRALQEAGPIGSLWCSDCTTVRHRPVWVTVTAWWPLRLGS